MDENAEGNSSAPVYHARYAAINRKEVAMKGKLTILLAVGALMLVLTAGVALADTIACQVGVACDGTNTADRMTGTDANDVISGFWGKDKIQDTAKHDVDTIAGGGDNDIIDVREGNTALGDMITRCEIKNP
jgi:Ca2+-binding RTX toxin-like protein